MKKGFWIFGKRNQRTAAPVAEFVETQPTARQVAAPTAVTLEPLSIIGQEVIDTLDGEVENAAKGYRFNKGVTTPTKPLSTLADLVREVYDQYVGAAQGVLAAAAGKFDERRKAFEELSPETDDPAALEGLRVRATHILERKANRLLELRKEISAKSSEIRLMLIGIYGDPDHKPKKLNKFLALVINVGTVFVLPPVVLLIELMLNQGVLRFETDRLTSFAFGLTVSLVFLALALIAADKAKLISDFENATDRFGEKFPKGFDRVSRQNVAVFRPSPDTFKLERLARLGLIGGFIALGVFRLALILFSGSPNLGGLAGTFGIGLLIFGAYVLKRSAGNENHPRLGELRDLNAELADLTARETALEDGEDGFREDLDAAVAEYNREIKTGIAPSNDAIADLTASRREFVRLWDEFRGANTWFSGLVSDMFGTLYTWFGELYPERQEELAAQATPERLRELADIHFRPRPLPDYARVLEYELPTVTVSAPSGEVTSEQLYDELWTRIFTEAETAAVPTNDDAPEVAVEPRVRPRLQIRGLAGAGL